jgi:hypothetical protein
MEVNMNSEEMKIKRRDSITAHGMDHSDLFDVVREHMVNCDCAYCLEYEERLDEYRLGE